MTSAARAAYPATPSARLHRPPAAAEAAARTAGLRHVTDAGPGIRRISRGASFRYVGPDGRRIRTAAELRRIRALAIPPAWSDVWISPDPNGHVQATGRDARGRKQYRYHVRWRAVRDETKFGRMIAFAEALPLIRGRVDADLRRPGLPRERVVAAVVGLLEATLIRVGNEEYARHNRSFGLTTLRDRHVDVDGSELRFRFRAKAGRLVSVGLRDRRLARVVRRCQELPGQELFQYEDETGALQAITSDDVNAYLRETAGRDFTAKDFRTWAGTVLAYRALRSRSPSQPGEAVTRHAVPEAIREVAAMLGNTAAVCRSSYVHPAVVDAYLDGSIGRALVDAAEERDRSQLVSSADEERAVVDLLRRRLVADPGTPRRQSRRKAPAGKRAGRAEAETAV